MRKLVKTLLTLFILFCFVGCNTIVTNDNSGNNNIDDHESQEELSFYGTWTLERVVLRSKMYSDDIEKNGEIIPVDVENYLGYEIEFNPKFFRLGEQIYSEPTYTLHYVTVDDYEEGGRFRLTDNYPSLQEFIINEQIDVNNMDEYDYLGYVPLLVYDIAFSDDYHIPVGASGVMLNEDAMLIGVWGKIILAQRQGDPVEDAGTVPLSSSVL